MNRRTYLAMAGLAAAGTAGCTGVLGTTHLQPGEPEDDILSFTDDGEDILRIQVIKQYSEEAPRQHYPFFIATWQPDGVRVDSLRFEFRSPPHPSGFEPAGINLREGAHAHKASLSRDADNPSTTIVDLPDTSDIGRGSVRVDILFDGGEDEKELWINTAASLSTEGILKTDYSAHGDFVVDFP